ncbi:MAG: hypothetical protein IKY83_03255 [Proteobacteria bacterium]|nr:hypothetical protein [Pseudomonadota bacterium]
MAQNQKERESRDAKVDNGMSPPARKNKRPPQFEHKKKPHRVQGEGVAEKPHRVQSEGVAEKPHRGHRESSEKGMHHRAQNAKPAQRRGTRNPRELVVEALIRIEGGGFSNIVWDNAMRCSDLSNLDKMLATRIFYGTLSNMRLIDALWADIEPEMLRRADNIVKMTLRSAMYQLVFLDRVPAYSIVSTSVDIVKRLRNQAASGYCNALLRKAVARQSTPEGLAYKPTGDTLVDFSVKYSLNEALASLILREFGEDAETIAQSMLSVPRMVLRVNRSRTDMSEFESRESVSVERSALLPELACAVLNRHQAIDDAIEKGDVCVQDEAAQLAVCGLGMPSEWGVSGSSEVHIWDACAGLGGKTIHILDEIACDKGDRQYAVLSTDLYANKLERLKDYQQKYFPDQKLITKARDLTVGGSVPLAPFDVILVDAPCSGLGVLRRHPEVKLTRTTEAIESLVVLQKQILDNVCRHLRVGGILVYAVCSITLEECEHQVESFLASHPNYRADALPASCLCGRESSHYVKYLPHADGCDGFFIARFMRLS